MIFMEILEEETFLCWDEKWHTKKKVGKRKFIFFSQSTEKYKKSFVSGRSYELFCAKKGKFSKRRWEEEDAEYEKYFCA